MRSKKERIMKAIETSFALLLDTLFVVVTEHWLLLIIINFVVSLSLFFISFGHYIFFFRSLTHLIHVTFRHPHHTKPYIYNPRAREYLRHNISGYLAEREKNYLLIFFSCLFAPPYSRLYFYLLLFFSVLWIVSKFCEFATQTRNTVFDKCAISLWAGLCMHVRYLFTCSSCSSSLFCYFVYGTNSFYTFDT